MRGVFHSSLDWLFQALLAGLVAGLVLGLLVGRLEWLVVALHVLILGVGAVIFFRPSLLKDVEKTANRWHEVPTARSLDVVVARLEPGMQLHPRLYGLVLVVAAGGCLTVLV